MLKDNLKMMEFIHMDLKEECADFYLRKNSNILYHALITFRKPIKFLNVKNFLQDFGKVGMDLRIITCLCDTLRLNDIFYILI